MGNELDAAVVHCKHYICRCCFVDANYRGIFGVAQGVHSYRRIFAFNIVFAISKNMVDEKCKMRSGYRYFWLYKNGGSLIADLRIFLLHLSHKFTWIFHVTLLANVCVFWEFG